MTGRELAPACPPADATPTFAGTARSAPPTRRRTALAIAAWVAVGAVVRAAYLASFPNRPTRFGPIGGDGLQYHLSALRWADGERYVGLFGEPSALHPPGWATVLGVFASVGGDTLLRQQLLGAAIGLALVVAIALATWRTFGRAAGVWAAALAALYPGLWVLEANVLSEPLALLLTVAAIACTHELAVAARPRWLAATAVVLALGVLVRPELLTMLGLVPIALRRGGVAWPRAAAGTAVAGAAIVLAVLPWSAYNAGRFDAPVLLSTNGGTTLLAGTCPPHTTTGDERGFYSLACVVQEARRAPGADGSELDRRSRQRALEEVRAHPREVLLVAPARLGRMLGVYRPTETVRAVAAWHGIDPWPIWAWVGSFLALLPLAVVGAVAARRRGTWWWPVLVPIVTSLAVVLVFYGEPRYHSPADASVLMLAATGCAAIAARLRRRSGRAGVAA